LRHLQKLEALFPLLVEISDSVQDLLARAAMIQRLESVREVAELDILKWTGAGAARRRASEEI
jgi:hypothetical protein